MWYNVISPFVPLNFSLYLTYPTRTGLDSLIFRNYTSYVHGNVYPVPKQHVVPPTYIPYSVGNQFPIVVQLMTNKEKNLINNLLLHQFQPLYMLLPIYQLMYPKVLLINH